VGGDAWVEEGPVELTDPGRVALAAGHDESSSGDAEIIWDDQPGGSERQADRTRRVGQPAEAPTKAGDGDDPFWEEDANRLAASRSPGGPEAQPRTDQARPSARSRPRRSGQSGARTAAASPTSRTRLAAPVEEVAPPARSARRRLSSLTLILIVVPALVIATITWRVWRQGRQKYPQIAEKGLTEGIPALEAGDFDNAYQLLSAAKSAVNALGGAIEGADDIRQSADEAAIFVDQSTRSLEELLDEAGRTDPQVWASRFETLYKGRGYLFDSVIADDEPKPGRSSPYMIDYVIMPTGGASSFQEGHNTEPSRVGLIDFTGFQLFEVRRPRKGEQVTFGARLASFQFDAENKVWWIGLDPKTGVFIKHTKALETIGWPRGGEATPQPEGQP
jgi:hypothetical protein